MGKTKSLALLLLLCSSTLLFGGTYLGLSQGNVSSSLEVGMITRRFEQQLTFSLPTLVTTPDNYWEAPAVSTSVLFRTTSTRPVVLGIGGKALLSWETTNGMILGLGLGISVSYEFIGKRGILFVEGSYLPYSVELGTLSTTLGEQQIEQYVRFGYRYVL